MSIEEEEEDAPPAPPDKDMEEPIRASMSYEPGAAPGGAPASPIFLRSASMFRRLLRAMSKCDSHSLCSNFVFAASMISCVPGSRPLAAVPSPVTTQAYWLFLSRSDTVFQHIFECSWIVFFGGPFVFACWVGGVAAVLGRQV